MDEDQQTTQKSSSGLVIGLIILAAIAVGGYFVISSKSQKTAPAVTDQMPQNQEVSFTPTPQESIPEGAITVEGGGFYFKPNEIKAKVGQPVTIVFNNTEGVHDFVIDEFQVNSGPLTGGKSKTVTFTPDRAGVFEFYCSVGNHRQMGMKGTLTVE